MAPAQNQLILFEGPHFRWLNAKKSSKFSQNTKTEKESLDELYKVDRVQFDEGSTKIRSFIAEIY